MNRLSICISTFKRARFIGETLDSILAQVTEDVEVIVVDGASPDETSEVLAPYVARHANVRYFREEQNSGVDADYDKAVVYARGDYCWLMTDDDLVLPGAITEILESLEAGPDLVVLNSEVRNADLSVVLKEAMMGTPARTIYALGDADSLLSHAGAALSFIGGVVVRRDFWLSRERAAYYGSLFVHVGVIFQQPPPSQAMVMARPMISIRYGNAMWTSRGFEIWMFMWPALIWGLPGYTDDSKAMVTPREPWRKFRRLLYYRALGCYASADYRRLIVARTQALERVGPLAALALPHAVANALMSVICYFFEGDPRMNLHDLSHSAASTWVSRALARRVGV